MRSAPGEEGVNGDGAIGGFSASTTEGVSNDASESVSVSREVGENSERSMSSDMVLRDELELAGGGMMRVAGFGGETASGIADVDEV